jgi:hypothetical protein
VTVSPSSSAGLLGSASLSFDAATGAPLSFSIDARGSSTPVLALTVTGISYGAVPDSTVELTPPPGAHIVTLTAPSAPAASSAAATPVSGLAAVAQAVPFTLVAPDSIDGLARGDVRLLGSGASAGALIAYGQGLGSLTVVEHAAGSTDALPSSALDVLPGVSINGASGHELVTALGTIIAFDHAGVSFAVAGSVSQADAETAARALAS